MAAVTTVLGPIAVEALDGRVLAHEHLHLDLRHTTDPAAVLDDEDAVVAELARLHTEHGLNVVIELTCLGMGRDAGALARITQRSGVAVVAATGFYYERFHPSYVAGSSVSELTDRLMDDIELGLDGSGARPGVIGEVGSHGEAPSAAEERCLQAAAHAAIDADLSVATHAQLGRGGLRQLELLTDAGLSPQRVSIGHQDLLDDPATHRQIAGRGAYVAFDTVGKDAYQPDSVRIRLVLELLQAGHAARLLLSNDVSRGAYLAKHGGHGYGQLFESFVPALSAAGVDDPTLRLILHDNPLRFLTDAS